MTKISRRDILKLLFVSTGAVIVLYMEELIAWVDPELAPPVVAFSSWGQNDLSISALTIPYQDLR